MKKIEINYKKVTDEYGEYYLPDFEDDEIYKDYFIAIKFAPVKVKEFIGRILEMDSERSVMLRDISRPPLFQAKITKSRDGLTSSDRKNR